MASINEIELKNIEIFTDNGGCVLAQGDVWYKNQKLGHWTQDPWGIGDNYDFDISTLDNEVQKYSKLRKSSFSEGVDLDILLSDLLVIKKNEDAYKKCLEAGYKNLIIAQDGYHTDTLCTNDDEIEIQASTYFKSFIEDCKACFLKDWEPKSIKIYTSMNDFKIAV